MRPGRQEVKNGSLFLDKYPKAPDFTSYRPKVSYNTRSISMGQKL